jgi:O-acetyl-ADP-ribose deacetylase (regulator of RNase III)
LKSGNACKSLGLKAGGKLQEACNKMYPKGIQSDEVAVIKGCGNLACKYVYLTTLPTWTSGEEMKEVCKIALSLSNQL